MATLTANLSSAVAFQSAKDFFATAKNAMVKSYLMRKTVAELQSLDSRELADLGIVRSEIKSIAQNSVYGL